jgi:hypothetical protein
MSGEHEETTQITTIMPDRSVQLLSSGSQFRNQVIGTITLTALLVAIFQAEVLVATALN